MNVVSLLMQPSRHAPQCFPLPSRVIRRGHRVVRASSRMRRVPCATCAVIVTRIGECGVQFAVGVSRAAHFSDGLQVARRGADLGEQMCALPKELNRPVQPDVVFEGPIKVVPTSAARVP